MVLDIHYFPANVFALSISDMFYWRMLECKKMDIIKNFYVFLHQVSNYRSMTSSGEEGATYCCCSWKRLPRALKWAIIGCCVVMLASFIATLYIFTKHGAGGFSPHGSGQWRQLVAARRVASWLRSRAFSTNSQPFWLVPTIYLQ